MKILAIIMNIVVLGILVYLIIDESPSGDDWLLFGPLLITPIISLMALFLSSETWIGLYFKRKALEEKKKINSINNE